MAASAILNVIHPEFGEPVQSKFEKADVMESFGGYAAIAFYGGGKIIPLAWAKTEIEAREALADLTKGGCIGCYQRPKRRNKRASKA